mmetsp:Transcript_6036/g.20385  ORF Transcript_6036/g.20385 Transcript_6036/m.20385 type:complete len:152 (-) Transcript_6036:77-532(-)
MAPKEPLVSLCTGLAFLHVATGKRVRNRRSAVLRAFAFLSNYVELVGRSPEACYNLARAYHQLGLFSNAVPLYEEALAKSAPDKKGGSDHLGREAAHNLALIHKRSGSEELARQVLKEHVVIEADAPDAAADSEDDDEGRAAAAEAAASHQ